MIGRFSAGDVDYQWRKHDCKGQGYMGDKSIGDRSVRDKTIGDNA